MTREALAEAVGAALAATSGPMQWGKDDCGLWCADILRGVLGYDPAVHMRRRYTTPRGARRALGKGALLGDMRRIAKRHGWAVIDPTSALPGDMGLADTVFNGKPSLSCVICRAPGWFVGRSAEGVIAIPARRVRKAFAVLPFHASGTRGNPLQKPWHPQTPATVQDPVSIALGISALTGTFVSVGVVSSVLTTALGIGLSIGLNYAATALLSRGSQPLTGQRSAPNDPSVRYSTRQPIPPKRYIYGTAQVGGALFFEQIKNPYLYQGWMLCAKPIQRIRKVWLGKNELDLGTLQPDRILLPIPVSGQPNYADNVCFSHRLGAAGQAGDPLLLRDFFLLQGSELSQNAGTIFGDMTGSGGIAAAVNGEEAQPASSSASLAGTGNMTATLGKDWGSGVTRIISGVRIVAPNNNRFTTSTSRVITVTVQASTDNFSASIVTLYTSDAINADTIGMRLDIGFTPGATAYRYHRVQVTEAEGNAGAHTMYCAQLYFAEASGYEFLQSGIATASLRYSFGADAAEYTELWGQTQRPNPIFLVDGIAVPDPRKSGHTVDYDWTDPAEVAAAEATWEWSDNAALCQAHYLTQPWGGRIDPRRMDWDKVALAADRDDTLIGTSGGTFIRRGTINGLITADQRPLDVLSAMLSANRGFVLSNASKVWINSSAPRPEAITLADGDFVGALEYRAAKPKKDLINRAKSRFVATDREYQTTDGPVLDRADLQAEDGDVLEAVVDMPFTDDHRRAQMLLQAFVETSRLGKRLSCTVDVRVLATASDELIGNAVRVDSDIFAQFNGLYIVESWSFVEDFSAVQLSLGEYDGDIENAWTADDEQAFELAPVDIT